MGVVCAARDARLGRQVALKALRTAGSEPSARERFWREARAAASISHPRICQLFDVGEADGLLFVTRWSCSRESRWRPGCREAPCRCRKRCRRPRGCDLVAMAMTNGFHGYPGLVRDPWLDPIRSDAGFVRALRVAERGHRDTAAAFEREGGPTLLAMR